MCHVKFYDFNKHILSLEFDDALRVYIFGGSGGILSEDFWQKSSVKGCLSSELCRTIGVSFDLGGVRPLLTF